MGELRRAATRRRHSASFYPAGYEAGGKDLPGWTIVLDEQKLSNRSLRELASVVYHEARHAEQDFLILRVLAAEDLPGMHALAAAVPARVREAAARRPLIPGSAEYRAARHWYDWRLGILGQQYQAWVAAEQARLQGELDDALQALARARRSGAGPGARAPLAEAVNDAVEAYNAGARRAYQFLPDEFDAFALELVLNLLPAREQSFGTAGGTIHLSTSTAPRPRGNSPARHISGWAASRSRRSRRCCRPPMTLPSCTATGTAAGSSGARSPPAARRFTTRC